MHGKLVCGCVVVWLCGGVVVLMMVLMVVLVVVEISWLCPDIDYGAFELALLIVCALAV